MQRFTPRPVNQKEAYGDEADRGIAKEGGAKCISTVHTELLD